jgi:hypothetical protein
MPAPDSIKDQQSHLQALALKPSSETAVPDRAVPPAEDPLSMDRINARVNQPSQTLENILHRQEPVPRFGINE